MWVKWIPFWWSLWSVTERNWINTELTSDEQWHYCLYRVALQQNCILFASAIIILIFIPVKLLWNTCISHQWLLAIGLILFLINESIFSTLSLQEIEHPKSLKCNKKNLRFLFCAFFTSATRIKSQIVVEENRLCDAWVTEAKLLRRD